MQYIVWILMALFCLNRLVFWILAARWKEEPGKLEGAILYAVVGSTDLFMFLLPLAPQPRFPGLFLVWRIIGVILFAVGVVFMRKGMTEFNKFDVSIRPDMTPKKLVTDGIYNVVRHPLYISLTIIFAGWSLIWAAKYSLWFVPVFFLLNV